MTNVSRCQVSTGPAAAEQPDRLPNPPRRWLAGLTDNPLAARLARGAFWSLAGAVCSRGSTLVGSILVARLLGKEGFGEFGIIQSTILMFQVFAGFGLGLTATKYVAEFRDRDPARAGRIIALSNAVSLATGFLAAAALALLAPWLAEHALSAPQLAPALRLSAILVLFAAINGAQTGALSGFEAFKTIAKVNLAAGVLSLPLLVAGAWVWRLEGAVLGLGAGLLVNTLMNRVALNHYARKAGVPTSRVHWHKEWRLLGAFSLPLILSELLVSSINWLAIAFIVPQPNGFHEIAILTALNQAFTLVQYAPYMIGTSLLPIISSTSENHRFRLAYKLSCSTVTVLVPVIALGIFMGPTYLALFDLPHEHAALAMFANVSAAALISAKLPYHQVLVSMDKAWPILWLYFVGKTVFLAAFFTWPTFSALGFVIARLCGLVIETATFAIYTRRIQTINEAH